MQYIAAQYYQQQPQGASDVSAGAEHRCKAPAAQKRIQNTYTMRRPQAHDRATAPPAVPRPHTRACWSASRATQRVHVSFFKCHATGCTTVVDAENNAACRLTARLHAWYSNSRACSATHCVPAQARFATATSAADAATPAASVA
jgi:hypothetical protein